MDAEFLAAVARAIAPSRPPARVAVADVDLDARRATLLQNRNLLDGDDARPATSRRARSRSNPSADTSTI